MNKLGVRIQGQPFDQADLSLRDDGTGNCSSGSNGVLLGIASSRLSVELSKRGVEARRTVPKDHRT